jgi:hypothetical protein
VDEFSLASALLRRARRRPTLLSRLRYCTC